MLQYDFANSVGCWIGMTSHAVRRALDAELARENITIRQWEVLAHIAFEGNPSQVELAEKLGIEAPTLAGILTRMERDGWLVRFCCPQDRRRKRLKPTPRAEQVWNRMVECCHRVREQAVQGLSPNELDQFRHTCEVIRRNLGNFGDEPPEAEGDDCGQGILSEARAAADTRQPTSTTFTGAVPHNPRDSASDSSTRSGQPVAEADVT